MAEQHYHNAIVERSWAALQELRRRYQFVLIGGWAAWVHTRGAKSRDIDIVVDYPELARLRVDYQVRKNERLKKYEIKADGFDIDIYVPHYSTTLALPPEFVRQRAENREGFLVPDAETLLALKLGAWAERRGTPKGTKDQIDIQSLLPFTSRERFAAMLERSGIEQGRAATLQNLYDEVSRDIPRRSRQPGRAPGPERDYER